MATMADNCISNEIMSYPNFGKSLQRKWIRASNPSAVVIEEPDSKLNFRITEKINDRSLKIKIHAHDKQLQNVALSMDSHQKNFILKGVFNEKTGQKLHGVCNGKEWQLKSPDHGLSRVSNFDNDYQIEVNFKSSDYGTYRQNIFFYFGRERPVILRKICIDCVPVEDLQRLNDASQYVLNLNQRLLSKGHKNFVPFSSPFVTAKDPREEYLDKAYPYPETDHFFLTHSTLTERSLTPSNYKGRLHELVTVEELARHEQVARYNEAAQLRLSNNYIIHSDTDGSSLAKYAPPSELFAQLPLGRELTEDTKCGRLFLRGCNSIVIRPIGENPPKLTENDMVFEAHVEDKCTNTIYARLSKECVEKLGFKADTDLRVQVQFVLNRLPFCEWHRAIDCLPDTKIVFPSSTHKYGEEHYIWNKRWDKMVQTHVLNDKQKKAVAVIMAPKDDILPPILLLGPFGTGKTSTIAETLRILLLDDPTSKIILCTQSNSAADLYVKDFFHNWYQESQDPRLKPVRIYYKGRGRNTVHTVVREYTLTDQSGRFREPTKEDIAECGLIITTLATSSCLTPLDLEPSHIVIDEAAQALECEALTALALANERTRIVLAGDQMQLAPEVYSDLARERGLGTSLLERLHLTYKPNHPCRIQLCKNYRAHADIVKLTSQLFYGGQVESGAILQKHPLQTPLMFYAVEGQEAKGNHSTGFFNNEEVAELVARVDDLKRNWPKQRWGPYGEGSIGVLAHYMEQVYRIRNELRKHRLQEVNVERVLNVQGKQFTAVFISTVRTRHCSRHTAEVNITDYGFLTNPRLLNTAVTRAKCLVAIVGDPVALLTVGCCRTLWQQFFKSATIHGVDEDRLNHHLISISQAKEEKALNPLAEEFVPRNPPQPLFVEYVTMPVNYPVIHCAVDWSERRTLT